MIPRKYQQEAVDAVSDALRSHRKVGAVLPTGSGKSLVETMLIDSIVDCLGFNQAVLVVCHLTDVVDQLHTAYLKSGRHGSKSVRISSRTKPRMTTRVIFDTVQSVTSARGKAYWTSDPMRKDIVAVIVDEAHQFGCDSYHTMDHELFPLAKFIGFSATPYRSNQYSFSQFDVVPFAIDTQTLIDQGYLTPPRLFQLKLEGVEKAERMASVIRVWRAQERERSLVSIVYLRTTSEAQEMRLIAEEEGIRVAFVDGQSSDTYCRSLYDSARAGEIEMIVNCRKLETGIDIPNIGAVFMPFGTGSVVTYLQRIGRALRPYPGKTEAHVYVLGDSPSIQKGKWLRVHQEALNAKKDLDPLEKLQEELEELEADATAPGRIAWTKDAIAACEILLKAEMRGLAEIIAEKKFPQKYAKAIKEITARIDPKAQDEAAPKIPLSESQNRALTRRFGFDETVGSLSTQEAGALLSAISDFYARSPWILQSGPHAGKHISETPPMYRRNLKDPANRLLWQRWKNAGSPQA